MLAAKNGHKEVVLILLQKGANPNLVNAVSAYIHNKFVNDKFHKTEDEIELIAAKLYSIIVWIIFFKNMANNYNKNAIV